MLRITYHTGITFSIDMDPILLEAVDEEVFCGPECLYDAVQSLLDKGWTRGRWDNTLVGPSIYRDGSTHVATLGEWSSAWTTPDVCGSCEQVFVKP